MWHWAVRNVKYLMFIFDCIKLLHERSNWKSLMILSPLFSGGVTAACHSPLQMQILHPVTQSVAGSLWVASHLKCMYRPWSWQGLGSKIQSFDLWLSSSLLARSETKVQIARVAKLLHHGCQSHSSSHTHLRHLDDSACSVKYCTTKMRAVLRCSVDCAEH